MESDIIKILHGAKMNPPPVWLMRQAGRYLPEYRKLRSQAKDFLEFCYTPDLAVEATLQPLRRYDLSAAIIFSDILVIPDALGQELVFTEGTGPQLTILQNEGDLNKLSNNALPEKLAPVYEALRQVRAELPKDKALLGFAGAPWTLAVYMLGGGAPHDFASLKNTDHAFMNQLLNLLCDCITQHLRCQADNGADAVQIFDSWAGALANDSALYQAWVIEPHRKILESLRESHPNLPVICFPRGSDTAYESFCQTLSPLLRPGAIGIDENTSLEFAARVLQPLLPVQGNLASALLLEEDFVPCEAAAKNICKLLSGGGHIFNLGHGVDKTTHPDTVAKLIEVIKSV